MSRYDKTHDREHDRQHKRAVQYESLWVMLDLLDRQIIDDELHPVGKVDDVDFVADGPGRRDYRRCSPVPRRSASAWADSSVG